MRKVMLMMVMLMMVGCDKPTEPEDPQFYGHGWDYIVGGYNIDWMGNPTNNREFTPLMRMNYVNWIEMLSNGLHCSSTEWGNHYHDGRQYPFQWGVPQMYIEVPSNFVFDYGQMESYSWKPFPPEGYGCN